MRGSADFIKHLSYIITQFGWKEIIIHHITMILCPATPVIAYTYPTLQHLQTRCHKQVRFFMDREK